MSSSSDGARSLLDYFQDLEDQRMDRRKAHPLINVLFIAVCAVLSGAEGWKSIETFARIGGRSHLPSARLKRSRWPTSCAAGRVCTASRSATSTRMSGALRPSPTGRLHKRPQKRISPVRMLLSRTCCPRSDWRRYSRP